MSPLRPIDSCPAVCHRWRRGADPARRDRPRLASSVSKRTGRALSAVGGSCNVASRSRSAARARMTMIPYILNDRHRSCIPYSRCIAPVAATALGDLGKMPTQPAQVGSGRFNPGGGFGRFNLEPRLNIRRKPNDGDDDATNGKASGCDKRGCRRSGARGVRGSPRDAELSGSRADDSSDPRSPGKAQGPLLSPIGPAGMPFLTPCWPTFVITARPRTTPIGWRPSIPSTRSPRRSGPSPGSRRPISARRSESGCGPACAWPGPAAGSPKRSRHCRPRVTPASTANRKRWVDFVRTDLGTALREYESAPTVAKRQVGARQRSTSRSARFPPETTSSPGGRRPSSRRRSTICSTGPISTSRPT